MKWRLLVIISLALAGCEGVVLGEKPSQTVDPMQAQVDEINAEYVLLAHLTRCIDPNISQQDLEWYLGYVKDQTAELGRKVLDKEVLDARETIKKEGLSCEAK